MNYPMIWLVLLVVFAGVEGMTAGLVSIWFCTGSLVALLAAWMNASILVQIALFVVVSLLTMAVVRPLAKKHLQPHLEKTNADRILDAEGIVTETVDNLAPSGQVKVGGTVWTARSASGENIPVGTVVRVLRIEGVKAMVAVFEKGQGDPK